MEIHLDNPNLHENVKVNSGIKLYYAEKKLRKYDAGCLVLGDGAVTFPDIPARKPRNHYESTCPAACTERFRGDIYVFSSFLHMHSFGKEMWTTKYRNDDKKNKEVVNYKEFWNFGFQNTVEVNYTISKGDSLSTHCVYDTSKSKEKVTFGLESEQEMCMDFVFYYPKENAGLACGYIEGGITYCKDRLIRKEKNPKPDGEIKLPIEFSKGRYPRKCPVKGFPFIDDTRDQEEIRSQFEFLIPSGLNEILVIMFGFFLVLVVTYCISIGTALSCFWKKSQHVRKNKELEKHTTLSSKEVYGKLLSHD